MIYLDTSAVLKLVVLEEHSVELGGWLQERSDSMLISSDLLRVELLRAVRRKDPRRLSVAAAWLRSIDGIAIGPEVIETASAYTDANLRSLDAIHLASAARIALSAGGPLESFVSYDARLRAAAESHGVQTSAPGMAA